MSLLKSLTTDESIANEKDSVGGGNVLESAIYDFEVTMAYLTKAASEAIGVVLHFKTEDNKELRQTIYITSGKEKGCKNYYENAKGEKQYLPGFNTVNSLALLTVGKELSELDTEEKLVKVYSSTAKAEVPTKVQVITELLGKRILAGVLKQNVDKTKKNDVTQKYKPTGETRFQNEIDKLFRQKDSLTTAEVRAQAEEPAFINTWKEKFTGVVVDKTSKDAKPSGVAGAPKAGGVSDKPKSSLFG